MFWDDFNKLCHIKTARKEENPAKATKPIFKLEYEKKNY